MSSQLTAINQDHKIQTEYEYKQTPNAEDTQYNNEDQNRFPSPVLIAMSANNENLDQHKELFQQDFIREDTFDLDIQCGKLNSQYISGANKTGEQFSSQETSSESHNEDLEQPTSNKQTQYKQQTQKNENIEEIYCNQSIEKVGYYRLLQVKNSLQSMMKFNFPEQTFQLVHDSNPLDRNFFKNQILNTLIQLNEKVPPRVIEKSKPIVCCQKLLGSIRIYGYSCIMSALISLVLMISNFLCYKSQPEFSMLFILASTISISSIFSYYFFFRQLTMFQHKNFLQWTLFFAGISAVYLFLFISGYVVGNQQGIQFTTILLSLNHLLLSFITKETLYKFIRFLVLLRVLPESELQIRFSYFY